MELDALDGEVLVANTHDHAVLGLAGYDEALRHRLGLDDERVVPRSLEALRQPLVHPLAVMENPRRLAVYGRGCAHDLPPVGLSYRLMAQADAQHRYTLRRRRLFDHLKRDTGFVRGAWAGRDDYPIRVEPGDLLERDFVVAPHNDLCFQLPEVLDQVIRKGVVVVYDQNPHISQDCSK